MGLLYLIRIEDTDYHKIGITSHDDLQQRLGSLQTSIPYTLIVLRAIDLDTPRTLETDLHTHLKQYRARGEWFLLATDKIQTIFDMFIAMHTIDLLLPNVEPVSTSENGTVEASNTLSRQTDEAVILELMALQSNGFNRAEARKHISCGFSNELWTVARRRQQTQILSDLRQKGVSREDARKAYELTFTDADWTLAGKMTTKGQSNGPD